MNFDETTGGSDGAGPVHDAALAIGDAAERRERIRLFPADADGGGSPGGGPCLHALVEASAARTPDAVAVEHQGASLTYAALEARAAGLAARLRTLGAGLESRVGVLLERSPEAVVAQLAVLKAGGAFVPMDPAYPAERIESLAADAGLRVVVTRESLRGRVPASVRAVCVDAQPGDVRAIAAPPVAAVQPANAAYVIYTSGSTGAPKGVVVPHAAVVNHAVATAAAYGLHAGDRVLQFASPAFDVALEEVFPTLARGATLVIRDAASMDSLAAFLTFAERAGLTVWNLPSPYWHELVGEIGRSGAAVPRALRLLVVGSEAASPAALAAWRRAAGERVAFRNAYGLTEATVTATLHAPAGDLPAEAAAIPIGGPIAHVRAYVLDDGGGAVAEGEPGELCLGGACVARGYLGRPAATAERFVPDPFAGVPGARMYRTGDRGRRSAGALELLGRVDRQVKVRGFRVEPEEIEAALRLHPAVREAAVLLREDAPGRRRLVGYAAADSVDDSALRAHLSSRLPAYMVPEALVVLPRLPLTPGGKVDRRALPAPSAPERAPGEAPRPGAEASIAAVWEDVLRVEGIGRDEGFLELGGNSLLAAQVVSRLRQALGVELSIPGLLQASTVAGVAEAAAVEAGAEPLAGPRPLPGPRGGDHPLSLSQERAWFMSRLQPTSLAYQFQAALRFSGALRVEVLERALEEMVRRHEILRTSFPEIDGRPVQRVHPPLPVAVPRQDLRGVPAGERRAHADALVRAALERHFDLARAPLIRWLLLRLDEDVWELVHVEHHIIHDGWSFNVFLAELLELYGAFAEGRPSPLAEPALQFVDYAAWQREWLDGPEAAAQLEFWTRTLQGVPPLLDVPTDRPRRAVQRFRGGVRRMELSAADAAGLRAFSRRENATLFMTMVSGFAALLHRHGAQEEVCVGSAVANRRWKETEGTIGMFVNSVVLRLGLEGDPGFGELVARTRRTTLDAYARQELPFDRVVQALSPERSLSHNPLHQVLFSFDDARMPELTVPGLGVTVREGLSNGSAKFDMNVIVAPRSEGSAGFSDGWEAGGLTILWEYDADLFDDATIDGILAQYRRLLLAATADPARRVSALPLLDDADRDAVLYGWNRTDAPLPAGRCVHGLVAARAAATPDAVAVQDAAGVLTYAALERRAAALAARLRALGVGPETRVGVCVERGTGMAAAVLGVLKAGGAYVPLDPSYPDDRLAYVAAHAGIGVLVCDAHLRGRVAAPGIAPVVPAEVEDDAPGDAPFDAGGPAAGPETLAYVLYTSGSTGRPKGVMVTHRAFANFLADMQARLEVTAADVLVAVTTLAFDIAGLELFLPLVSGARVVVADRGTAADGVRLAALLHSSGATVFQATPATFQLLVEAGWTGAPGMRVLAGGEAVPAELAEGLAERAARAWNVYGPTETTVWSTVQRMEPGAPVLIGGPIANTRCYVLDAHGAPLPPGVPGELWIGGAGVARGYLGQPGTTAERFAPDPFAGGGARMYRTGDRVRRRAGGALEFLGRTDHQVKVRGFRIEPGEIEGVLRAHPAVREAVAVVRQDGPGGRRLVAYVAGNALPGDAELRALLRSRLPEYMVPAALVRLEALPRTPNGKVDRRALPAPDRGADGARAEHVAPRSPVEEVVAELWAEVLGLPRVGVHDDFFALGGHSLLAARAAGRLPARLGREVPLRVVFESPTVAGVAAYLEGRAGPALAPLSPRADRPDPLPASPGQERLWALEQVNPGTAAYNLPLAIRLRGPLEVDALRRALAALAARHEALRTTLVPGPDGAPVQVIAPAAPVPLPVEALDGVAADERDGRRHALRVAEASRPMDLARGPLFRARLARFAPDDHDLLLTLHHAVADGWSLGVVQRELAALYAAFAAGEEPPLPPAGVQYADYVLWLREQSRGGALEAQLAGWMRALEGAPAGLDLPTDRPRPAVAGVRGGEHRLVLAPATAAALAAVAREERATPFMALLACWQLLLSRWSGQADVVVGIGSANRMRQEVEGTVGFFTNTLPIRARLAGDPSFRALLRQVRGATLDAYAGQDVPLEAMVEALALPREPGRDPLVQAVLVMDAGGGAAPPFGTLRAEAESVGRGTAKFDLHLAVAQDGDGALVGWLDYRAELFDPATIERMAAHLPILAGSAVAAPDAPVSSLALLPADERRRVVEEWSGAGTRIAVRGGLHQRFEAQAAACPGAVAVSHEGGTIAYGALNARANRVARRLRASGVGPESRVGLCVERSPELVVGILAILKAGGAYVPLDPGYPAERLAYMAQDSGVRVLLAGPGLEDRVPGEGVRTVALDDDGGDGGAAGEPDGDPGIRVDPGNLAYVIYTSGSTGRPKGVEVTHGNVQRLFDSTADRFGFGASDVWTLFHSYAFDFSVWELWGALLYGGRVVVVPWDVSRDPPAFRALLARERVTILSQTPSAFRALARADEDAPEPLRALRAVVFGGEALQYESLRGWLDRYGPARPRLVNMYGITETTVHVTWHTVAAADLRRAGSGVGGPIPDLRAYVLDGAGNPSPIGVAGELHVGGAGLARGYLGRPSLTARRFVPDPFTAEAGARLYRSGDLARWRADGTLEYLGRIDQQVKVRGFRIEPGEIEAALLAHPGVAAAAVVVLGEGDAASLAAYFVPAGAAPAAAELRGALAARLPEHMVPAAFVPIAHIPLTPNGKLDRRVLPAPDEPGRGGAEDRAPPRTPVEEVLAGIWCEVLRVRRVGVGENFFELGGHSLRATQAAARVRQAFGVELPLRTLFDAPTLEALADAVEALRRRGVPPLPPVAPTARTDAPPLSFAQERLWFLERLHPGSAVYNAPLALRIGGALDVAALERALGEMVARHEALRTTFAERDGAPVQVIAPVSPFVLPLEEVPGAGEEAREAEAARRAAAEAARPFDLSAGPLFRATLLRLADDEHLLLVCMHHIVTDAWSTGVLLRELGALYGACRDGGAPPLAPLPVQYADFAAWQRAAMNGEALERQLAYWRDRLSGAPALLELPLDRPRPPVQGYAAGHERFALPDDVVGALESLARREGATLYMVLLSAFQLLLSRYAGTDDVVVGSPSAGRTRREVEELVGFFVNMLALRTDLSGDPGFCEVLGRVREATLGAHEHQDVPFERLVEELHPGRGMDHSPVFQVVFTLEDAHAGEGVLPGLRTRAVEVASATTKFDLTLAFDRDAAGVHGLVAYRTELFERATVVRMIGHLRRVLAQVAEDGGVPLSRIQLLGDDERRRVLEEWNRTGVPLPAHGIGALFQEQASATPAAVALVCGDESVTYAALDGRANRLAAHLRRRGVRLESRVGVCLERGIDAIVAIVAILKAGGAYVPLDPSYPAERLAEMMAGASVSAVVTRDALRARLPAADAVVVRVDGDRAAIAAESADVPAVAAGPRNLAYVVHTSGSTGKPRGVGVEHRSVVRLVRGASYARLGPDEVILQAAPVAFDASTLEIWGALLNGGRLAVLPGAQPSLEELGRALARHGVTTLWLTAGLFQVMVQERLEELAGVRQLLAGGDVLPVEQVQRVKARFPGCRVINGYGPTENTTFTCCHTVPDGWDGHAVPVGAPISGTRVYVLDAALRPVPIGVAGELYAGGEGVARGYLGDPARTARRFVPDPFGCAPGGRLYRTGDRVRWRADGAVEYLGRLDEQVKIRGFRVEPGEVEAVLRRHPAVADCAVVAREEAPGDRRLVAYVVSPADAETLRAHLRGALPAHMLPAAFVAVDALPLTRNGKVDRRALPAPEFGAAEDGYVPPRTSVEEVLAEIWAAVLRQARVGVEDDFFALGGHSLLATRVVSRIRDALGVEVPLRALFDGPTVAALAGRVEELRRAGRPEPEPVAPVDRTGPLPLSFAQERLWFLDRMEPGSAFYNLPAALRLRGALDAAALERGLGEVLRRHEALRTTFSRAGGVPVQVVAPFAGFALAVDDLRALPEGEREAGVRRRAAAEAAGPFDLATGPLFRARLLRLADDEHVLLLCMHHVVSDGWSLGVLFRDLSAAYAASLDGRDPALPPPPVQYADFAAWQRGQLHGAALERQLAWWTERLAGAPALLELPTDHPRPAVQTYRGGFERVELPATLLEPLRALGRAEGATLFMVLLAAVQVLLARYAATDDVVVGSPVAGRSRREVEDLVGFFVNTMVLRTRLDGDPAFREALRRVRDATLGAFEHQDVPFEKLVEAVRPERSLSHSPLVQVMFALDEAGDPDLCLPGVRVERVETELATSKFDLTLGFAVDADGFHALLEYSADLWDRGTILRLAEHLGNLLEQVARDPQARLSELELAGPAERDRVVRAWNRTDAVAPAAPCVHQLVERQARRAPEAVALVHGATRLTYAELDARAGRLARRLARLGVGPEARVGVCLERGPELVVALLAVLKAGGAWVPLDPAYPAARLEAMLADCGARVLLTREGLRGAVAAPPGTAVVAVDGAVDGASAAPADARADAPAGGAGAGNLACLIYTSGSTGTPKGVAVEHRSLAAYLAHAVRAYALGPGDRVLQFHSISFDPAAEEIFATLSAGATLVLSDGEALADPREFCDACGRWGITLLDLPTAYWHTLVSHLETSAGSLPPSLRLVVTGGERLLAQALHAWRRATGGRVRLLNSYGPTEATIGATLWEAPAAGDDVEVVPIGGPVPGGRAYVLDAALRPVPVGLAGELYLGGVQVARGYAGRPALTAERFVPEPFGGGTGARLYRTGDRARWRDDGTLEYLGRTDAQVKVRGFRVEPGEVEAALRRHPEVRDCVVVARVHAAGDARLAAYVVGAADADAVRAHLRRSLPEHMLPASITRLEALPLTPNGKLDRRALPAPAAERAPRLRPAPGLEARIAALWQELLEVEPGVDDNFFDLGGHSLLLARLQGRLHAVLGQEVRLVELFQHPTVRSLAERLRATQDGGGGNGGARDGGAVDEAGRRGDARQAALGRRLQAARRRDG